MSLSQTPPADSVRAVLRDVFAEPRYRWRQAEDPLSLLAALLRRSRLWFDGLADAHPVVYWLLVGLLALVLTGLLAHLAYLIWRALRPVESGPRSADPVAAAEVRDATWYLRRVDELRQQGRYLEALGHRFTALLLQLDRKDALQYDPSKTPAEYASEARLDPDGRAAFGRLVAMLYRHLFGGDPCAPSDLDIFDREARKLGGPIAPG